MFLHALIVLILLWDGASFLKVNEVSINLPNGMDKENGIKDGLDQYFRFVFAHLVWLYCRFNSINKIDWSIFQNANYYENGDPILLTDFVSRWIDYLLTIVNFSHCDQNQEDETNEHENSSLNFVLRFLLILNVFLIGLRRWSILVLCQINNLSGLLNIVLDRWWCIWTLDLGLWHQLSQLIELGWRREIWIWFLNRILHFMNEYTYFNFWYWNDLVCVLYRQESCGSRMFLNLI